MRPILPMCVFAGPTAFLAINSNNAIGVATIVPILHGCRSMASTAAFSAHRIRDTHCAESVCQRRIDMSELVLRAVRHFGRALVFLWRARLRGAFERLRWLIVYCLCCCRGKCANDRKSDHDHVPLLSSMDDDDAEQTGGSRLMILERQNLLLIIQLHEQKKTKRICTFEKTSVFLRTMSATTE
jgi:hypothetical protein